LSKNIKFYWLIVKKGFIESVHKRYERRVDKEKFDATCASTVVFTQPLQALIAKFTLANSNRIVRLPLKK